MSDSPLTPDQDDAVRALLAAARHTDPTPPDVVARLDAELEALVADRREERAPAPVVSLAARRRRTAATLVLAAAAVVVAGVGIGQVLPSTTSGDDSSAGSAADTSTLQDAPMSAEADESEPDASSEGKAGSEPGAESEATQGEAQLRAPASVPAAVSALSSGAALKPQVRQVREAADSTSTARSYAADAACVLPAAESDEETVVSVTYDGAPGALVFRVPVADRQQVDVFVCGETVPERTLTLRAP